MLDIPRAEALARSGCFKSESEFVTALSSSSRERARYKREENFIARIVTGEPEPGKHGLYAGEIERIEIVKAMVESGLVKNANSIIGKIQVIRNLKKMHQTDYWRGYSFIKLSDVGEYSLYKVKRDDVSGLEPG